MATEAVSAMFARGADMEPDSYKIQCQLNSVFNMTVQLVRRLLMICGTLLYMTYYTALGCSY